MRAVLLLELDGRLAVAVVPVRPLVPAVGRLLLPTDGRVLLTLLVRPELLPAVVLPATVGRVPLIEPPAVVRPETEAPLCAPLPLPLEGRLIEPPVPVLP